MPGGGGGGGGVETRRGTFKFRIGAVLRVWSFITREREVAIYRKLRRFLN